jgi:hypothetical protein
MNLVTELTILPTEILSAERTEGSRVAENTPRDKTNPARRNSNPDSEIQTESLSFGALSDVSGKARDKTNPAQHKLSIENHLQLQSP